MKKYFSVVLTVLLCISIGFNFIIISSGEDKLTAPVWVTVNENSDDTKTVVITTPSEMNGQIDYYEYSLDDGKSWNILSDVSGGQFLIEETSVFCLRYYKDNVVSETFKVTVEINKIKIITSQSTGISLIIPVNSPLPHDIALTAYEIVNGSVYGAVQKQLGKNTEFSLYNVLLMQNGKEYTVKNTNTFIFSAGGFNLNYCELYHVTPDGIMSRLQWLPNENSLYCVTELTGLFVVAENKPYLQGDVSGDGQITAADARLALRASAKLQELTQEQTEAGDMDSDGKITASDARTILRISAGLEK